MEKPPLKTSILESVENQLLLARKLDSVYEHRPAIETFVGAMKDTKYEDEYTLAEIQKDEAYVKETRTKIEESDRALGMAMFERNEGGFQLSEIMQAMVVDRMNKHWFKGCSAIMTADYDDLRVGIDAVMKHEKGTYLGAAFDFTVTNQQAKIYEKLAKEWERNIRKGKVPSVKYFEDPDTKERGRLLVPKFIVGASKKDVEELAQAYLSDDLDTLEKHPFKYTMLLQIEEQLQTVLDYYETDNEGGVFDFAKLQYERIQNMVRGMKKDIHLDEDIQNMDLYAYTKTSVALDTMRGFRITHTHSAPSDEL